MAAPEELKMTKILHQLIFASLRPARTEAAVQRCTTTIAVPEDPPATPENHSPAGGRGVAGEWPGMAGLPKES